MRRPSSVDNLEGQSHELALRRQEPGAPAQMRQKRIEDELPELRAAGYLLNRPMRVPRRGVPGHRR